MSKLNKILLAILVFVVVCFGGFLIYESQQNTPKTPIENITPAEVNVEGVVKAYSDTEITIVVDAKDQVFTLDKTEVKDNAKIELNDTISIRYQKEEAKKQQRAELITLIKVHADTIRDQIASMSIEAKVGQMILARCPEANAVEDVKTYQLGGYMLFDRDVRGETKTSLKETLAAYQAQASIPLLIAVDEEGGTVNRLSNYSAFRGVPFHSPQALYQEGGMDLILSDNKEKAELLQSLGINVNLAPVSDVSTDPNDFINARSFGKDAKATADYISKVITQSKELGIGTTLKHFPGYGNNVDTHTGIAIDERSMESFEQSDLLPFQSGIAAGADSVLVSHNIINAMDPTMPASLSTAVHDLLRNKLQFNGVIMTDDLDMQAIASYTDYDTSAVTAIKAGNDLVLCSNYATQIPAIIQAVQNGDISEEQINQSVYRILTWKQNLHLTK